MLPAIWVEARLAACANLLPAMTSVYRWEGRINEDEEVVLIAKTSAERMEALKAAVTAHHPLQAAVHRGCRAR